MTASVFSPELLEAAHFYALKQGFVDPATAGGAPPGGDPAAMGGMPPGGDPAAMGGAPPMDPAAMGGAPPPAAPPAEPGITRAEVEAMIQSMGGAAGAGGAGGMMPKEKKVDVNTEIYHLKKMMAMLLEERGIAVPASMLLGDPADDPQTPPGQAEADPASAAYSPGSSIAPIQPLGGASPSLAAGGASKAGSFAQGRPAAHPPLPAMIRKASALSAVLREATRV